jgi:hypothetical protein
MRDFFKQLDYEVATEIEALTRLMYELREHRNDILAVHAVTNEDALLETIRNGGIEEHPSYEHYLAARILGETQATVRDLVAEKLQEAQGT